MCYHLVISTGQQVFEFLSYFILYCVLYVDRFYIALFSALLQTHRTLAACDSKRVTSFLQHTLNIHPSGVVAVVWFLSVGWLKIKRSPISKLKI